MKLVVATHNPGKVVEIRAHLSGLTVETLADHPELEMPPETAETFEENARAKAEVVARTLRTFALADDSGLAVDALGGAPGVRSARYAPGSDADRIAKLLAELEAVPDDQRTARFVCAMVLTYPGAERSITVTETCEGRIARAPRGGGGFGYDPVFLLEDGRTMAELTTEEKNVISHRGRALARILPEIRRALFA